MGQWDPSYLEPDLLRNLVLDGLTRPKMTMYSLYQQLKTWTLELELEFELLQLQLQLQLELSAALQLP